MLRYVIIYYVTSIIDNMFLSQISTRQQFYFKTVSSIPQLVQNNLVISNRSVKRGSKLTTAPPPPHQNTKSRFCEAHVMNIHCNLIAGLPLTPPYQHFFASSSHKVPL